MSVSDLKETTPEKVRKPRKPRKEKVEGKGTELLPEVRKEAAAYLEQHPNVAPRWFWTKLREIAAQAQKDALVGKLDKIAKGDS